MRISIDSYAINQLVPTRDAQGFMGRNRLADSYSISSATAQIHWATFTIDQTCANFIGKRTDLLLPTAQTQLLTLYLYKHNKILTQ